MTTERNRCPVCRARFRDSTECSRCGADLSPYMKLLVRAALLRQKSVKEFRDGNWQKAVKLALRADRLHHG